MTDNSTWQERLQTEFRDLMTKLAALNSFLTQKAHTLGGEEIELLRTQARAMQQYLQTLEKRLIHHNIPYTPTETLVASHEPELGEPVETGGHDIERDGPVPFDS